GFPVFAMNWTDPRNNELTEGFKEKGFLPEAFINLLAVLGWNDGSEKEIFSMEELIESFSIDRVHKSGAKFDFEKAKWFNQEWIKQLPVETYAATIETILTEKNINITDNNYFTKVLKLVKDRCVLLPDFYEQAGYFFKSPEQIDTTSIIPKWNENKTSFFKEYCDILFSIPEWNAVAIENCFKELAEVKSIKPGELQLPMRIMLVGGKYGPGVFDIAYMIGKEATIQRINKAITDINV
ncbi:MAG: glutamate--tRNA ligase family protein, partial [Ferruginibacter sp.]